MLISIKTGHRYQASHRKFIYGFKTFLSIYTLGNSNFSRKMVNSNEKSQTLYFSNKNIESTYNLTVVMPPVFEVSTFKLILKCIFANNFLWHLHNTRFLFHGRISNKTMLLFFTICQHCSVQCCTFIVQWSNLYLQSFCRFCRFCRFASNLSE